ncbi:MAG: EmrA/EmrK family multidrug efflux transporter periplasmic adaptor subunit, partial [Paraburkholderia sp.]|nr:EmrA/EmrK family multidrug efflux transporter periplasmic adaptor subunit [Paraburkholderia sp.]
VRIALDPRELAARPLRIGLSMTVDADTRDESGSQLGAAQNTRYRTDVFAQYDAQADGEIEKIIKQNEMTAAATASQPSPQRLAARDHKGNAG